MALRLAICAILACGDAFHPGLRVLAPVAVLSFGAEAVAVTEAAGCQVKGSPERCAILEDGDGQASALLQTDSHRLARDSEKFPNMKSLSDSLSNAAESATKIVEQGKQAAKQAVAGVKDVALGAFESAVAKVNSSLEVVGHEVLKMNSTAMKEIGDMDAKVKSSQDGAAVFVDGVQDVLRKIDPISHTLLKQLSSVRLVVKQVLATLHQETASKSFDNAMDMAVSSAKDWAASADDLRVKLRKATVKLTGRRPRARKARNQTEANASNVSLLSVFPEEELSEMLSEPMQKLKAAGQNLKDVAVDTTEAIGAFVDSATEAARAHVPGDLVDNVSSILQGARAKAELELAPIGDVGQEIVGAIFTAGGDAGLDFSSSSMAKLLPMVLLMPLFGAA